jgi:hypothetical protein
MLLYLFRLGPNMLSLIGRVYHMEHGFQFDKLLVGITYRYLKYLHPYSIYVCVGYMVPTVTMNIKSKEVKGKLLTQISRNVYIY